MTLINLILENKLVEAKGLIYTYLDSVLDKRIVESKKYVAENVYEMVELDEAPSKNIVKSGRILKIRRRIRRNKKGKIVVQRNVRKSALKGFRLSGNSVKRIPAIKRLQKARKLKRYWKTKGKAKLTRTLLKRKMSLRRRKSMGIR